MEKEWKPIPDFPGYEVSGRGRLRSYWIRVGSRSFISKFPQRILKTKITRRYERISIHRNGKSVGVTIHRLVLQVFVGPCPPGMEACHNDGNPLNNLLSNLRWDTPQNNQRDRIKHGTDNTGNRNGRALLTAEQAFIIFKSTMDIDNLAGQYGVSRETVKAIKYGRIWKHINTPKDPPCPSPKPY